MQTGKKTTTRVLTRLQTYLYKHANKQQQPIYHQQL